MTQEHAEPKSCLLQLVWVSQPSPPTHPTKLPQTGEGERGERGLGVQVNDMLP